MRFIRTLVLFAVVAVVAVLAYNYWSGNGWTLHPAAGSTGLNPETAREQGRDLVEKTATTAGKAATKVEAVVNEGALTLKIKSKMALDDQVKARAISVDTTGSVVTLSGTVGSNSERDRAVRLARETIGVTSVVDKLEVKKP